MHSQNLDGIYKLYQNEAGQFNYIKMLEDVYPQSCDKTQKGDFDLKELRQKFIIKGHYSYITLFSALKALSKTGISITYADLKNAFAQMKISIPSADIDIAFLHFDTNHDGRVDIPELIHGLCGAMIKERADLVKAAFQKLNKEANGLTYEALKSACIFKNHPGVLENRKTIDEAIHEFDEAFHQFHSICYPTKEMIDEETFTSFYEFVSGAIERSEYFSALINNIWGLAPIRAPQLLSSPIKTTLCGTLKEEVKPFIPEAKHTKYQNKVILKENKNESALPTFMEFRNLIFQRGLSGVISFIRQLKLADKQKKGVIDFLDFIQIIESFKLGLDEKKALIIRKIFENNEMRLNIEEIYQTIVGNVEKNRTDVMEAAYKSLDRSNYGFIDQGIITKMYNSATKTLIVNKDGSKLTTDDLICTFLENLDKFIAIILCRKKDGRVTKNEFVAYYKLISALVDDDFQFESMMVNLWKIPTTLSDIIKKEEAEQPQVIKEIPKVEQIQEKPEAKEEKKEKTEIINYKSSFINKLNKRGIRGVFAMVRGLKIYSEDAERISTKMFASFLVGYYYEQDQNKAMLVANDICPEPMSIFEIISFLFGDLAEGRHVFEEVYKNIGKAELGIDEIKSMTNKSIHPYDDWEYEYADLLEEYCSSKGVVGRKMSGDVFMAFHTLYTLYWGKSNRCQLFGN